MCYPSQPEVASLDSWHFSKLVRFPIMIHRSNFIVKHHFPWVLMTWIVVSCGSLLGWVTGWWVSLLPLHSSELPRYSWINFQLLLFCLIIHLLRQFTAVKVLRDVRCHLETKPTFSHYAEVMLVFVVYAFNASSRHWHHSTSLLHVVLPPFDQHSWVRKWCAFFSFTFWTVR